MANRRASPPVAKHSTPPASPWRASRERVREREVKREATPSRAIAAEAASVSPLDVAALAGQLGAPVGENARSSRSAHNLLINKDFIRNPFDLKDLA